MDNIFLENLIDDYISDKKVQQFSRDEIKEVIYELRSFIRSDEYLKYIFDNQDVLTKQQSLYEILDHLLYEYGVEDLDSELKDDTWNVISALGKAATYGAGFILSMFIAKLVLNLDTTLPPVASALNTSIVNIRKWIANSSISKWSETKEEQQMIILHLLDKNLSNCVKACGVTPEDGEFFNSQHSTFRKILFKSKQIKSSPEDVESIKCLCSCYLNYVTSLIAETKYLYGRCLEKTTTPNLDLPAVRSIPALTNNCDSIRKDLDNSIKEFNIFVKHLYKNDPHMKAFWLDMLEKKIESAKAGRKVSDYGPLHIRNDFHTKTIGFNS